MEIPIEQAGRLFSNIIRSFEVQMPRILMNGANVGSAVFQQRVFNQGKATDNSVQHYRSSRYKEKRTSRGRQVAYKDWIMTGDLFNSLGLRVRSKDVIEYAFNSSRQAEIAGYQEGAKQVGKPIFTLNAGEIKVIEDTLNADYKRTIAAVINNFPNMPNSVIQNRTVSRKISRAVEYKKTRNLAKRKKVKAKK